MKLLVCHDEILTGKRAFDGKSQASLIASILDRQPAPMAEGVSFFCPVWTLNNLSVIFSSHPQGGDEVHVSLSGCARALIRHVRSTAKLALQSNGSED